MVLVLLMPGQAHAYIGPGAGFALAGSFFAVFAAYCSALLTFITWPVRLLEADAVRLAGAAEEPVQARGDPRARRHGPRLDRDHARGGQASPPGRPARTGAASGRWAPRCRRSRRLRGRRFKPGSTPASTISSTSSRLTCAPTVRSSARSRSARPAGRSGWASIGFPLGKADLRLLRKSQPFWSILGKYGIFSCVQRVPITWPPEKLWGVLLSAMCVPDLRGTQGMFSYYTTRTLDEGEKIGGEVHHVTRDGETVEADLVGPAQPAPGRRRRDPAALHCQHSGARTARSSRSAADRIELRKDVYTDWLPVDFRAGPGVTVTRRVQVPAAFHRARIRALCHADQHRPRAAGDAGRLPVGLFDLPGEEARHVRHARSGRRHVGA